MTDNSNPLPGFLQMVVGGFARHVLTGIAGGLAVSAGLSSSQQTQFITGGAAVVVWVAGFLWSLAQKKAVDTNNATQATALAAATAPQPPAAPAVAPDGGDPADQT